MCFPARGWKSGESKRIPAFNYFHNCINRIHNEMISLSKDLSKAMVEIIIGKIFKINSFLLSLEILFCESLYSCSANLPFSVME